MEVPVRNDMGSACFRLPELRFFLYREQTEEKTLDLS
jgi:hypothetical protein